MQRCHELAGRERVLVLRSEDLYQRGAEVLAQVFDYLGLGPWQPKETGRNDMAAAPTTPLDSTTEAELRAFYRPHNARLFDYLGWEEGWAR